MSKLIFRSNYFKNEPAVHKSNYIKYLGTREGVEMNPEQMPRFLFSEKTKILREDAHPHAEVEFADASVRGAGTPQVEIPFYTDKDMHGKKENYIDYIAGRPGVAVEEGEQHGLFSYPGIKINLNQVMDEVANHKGNVWINVLSLKREDAKRLGYDDIRAWQNLLRRHVSDIAFNFSIEPDNLQWYAAFHNEGHHPHVHLVVYSKDENEGFIRKSGIKELKSKFVNDIFKDELAIIYSQKSKQRDMVKEQAKESLLISLRKLQDTLETGACENNRIDQIVMALGKRLENIKGKKVYGYLHRDVKMQIDEIVDKLAEIPEVKECYEKWMQYQNIINSYYHDDEGIPQSWNNTIPLSRNKEFKSIKNMIIREAIEQSRQITHREGYSQKGDEKNALESGHSNVKDGHSSSKSGHSDETGNEVFNTTKSAGHLAKQLEGIFNNLIGDAKGNNQSITESKSLLAEKEKKAALGQKDNDSENNENKKYMTM